MDCSFSIYCFIYSVFFITKFNNFSLLSSLLIILLLEINLSKSFISYMDVCSKYLFDKISLIKCWKTIFGLVQYKHSNIGIGVLFKSSFVIIFFVFIFSLLFVFRSSWIFCIEDSFISPFVIFILFKLSISSPKYLSILVFSSWFTFLELFVCFISLLSLNIISLRFKSASKSLKLGSLLLAIFFDWDICSMFRFSSIFDILVLLSLMSFFIYNLKKYEINKE